MTVTIDTAGRLVIPKEIREEAEIEPGTPLDIAVRDGVIEITPRAAGVELVRKGRWLVARPLKPGPPLTNETVNRVIRRIRNERARGMVKQRGR
jgi:AbrB family looped-hinge helix DNA binding protein